MESNADVMRKAGPERAGGRREGDIGIFQTLGLGLLAFTLLLVFLVVVLSVFMDIGA